MFSLNMITALIQQGQEIPTAPIAEEIEKGTDAIRAFGNLSIDDAISKIVNSMVDFAFQLLIAVVVFYIGRFIIGKIYRMVHAVMVGRNMDASLTTFVLSLIRIILYFILIVTIVSILGIETSSFLALFASAGVAIGMALSGTLQNFAGGVLILLLKPYKVGDYIAAQGYEGTVKEIQIFHTVINTIDNKAIIIPNGGLSTGSINNYSLEQYRRVDWTIALSYGTDYEKAAQAIREIVSSDERVVEKYIEDDMGKRHQQHIEAAIEAVVPADAASDEEKKPSWWQRIRLHHRKRKIKQVLQSESTPNMILQQKDCSPFVGLAELADSSINITVRVWTHISDYWPLYFEMNRRFYTELQQQGFSFPFPQVDVHIDHQP